jgi:hypothetical protein
MAMSLGGQTANLGTPEFITKETHKTAGVVENLLLG